MSSNTDTNNTAPPKRKPWVSCAECRRLRVRCDRKFPCGPCRRRGCGSICPDGTTTHGSADGPWIDPTVELKDNLQKLAERIKALEGALETFSAAHPLLTKEQKALKTKYLKRGAHNRKASTGTAEKTDEEPEETNRASSLIVRDDGVTECIAEEQGWWRYVHESENNPEQEQPSSLMLVTASFSLSLLMPCVHMFLSQQQYIKVICGYLPPAEETLTISNYFFASAGWMFNAIAKDEFMSQIFSLFYSPGPLPDVMDDNFAHRLSCLYSIIAIGYLFDPASCRKLESENAFRFACGAFLCGRGVEMPTLEALQALNLMNVHMWLVDPVQEKATNAAWILNGIIVKLCQAAGVHYDSKKLGLGEAEIIKRRRLVSDVYMNDYLMASLTLRPPTIIAEHFDPAHVNEQDNSGGMTFSNWKIAFNAECVAPIFTETLGTTQPAYATITRLNQKLQEHVMPELLQIRDGQNELDPGVWLQRYTAQLYRSRIVLTLHQSWFARALNDRSKDPLTSPYKESVNAVFRTAMSIIQVIEQMRNRLPHPTDRYWFIWKTLFAASVVIGSLVARSPELPLAKEGIERLDKAHELFLNVHSQFGDKALDALNNMRMEARRSTQVADRSIPSNITSVATPAAHSSPPGLVHSSSSSSAASSPPSAQPADILAYFPELGASFSAATMPPKMGVAPDSMHAVVPTLAVPPSPFTSLGTRAAQLSKAQFVASGTLPMSRAPQPVQLTPPILTPGPSTPPHPLAMQRQAPAPLQTQQVVPMQAQQAMPMQAQQAMPMQAQQAMPMQAQGLPSVTPEYMSPNNVNFMQPQPDWGIPPANMAAVNMPAIDPIFHFPGMLQANSAWLPENTSNNMLGYGQNQAMPVSAQPMPDIDMNVEIDWSQVFMDAGLQM